MYLDIARIEIRNFLSFGDYETSLEVSDLGSMLVLGEIGGKSKSSNGAGKTSLLNAFLWCLFGKTFNNPNPGDRVINWGTGSNCLVKITTRDGWSITRTRKFAGKSELSIFKDGVDQTLSTTTNAQKFLESKFNLDYDIFCSSVFCGPRAFMEMSPQKRKDSLERILGLDKLNDYAKSAKMFCDKTEREQEIIRVRLTDLGRNLAQYEENLTKNAKSQQEFETQREEKIAEIGLEIQEVDLGLNQISLPDVDKLKKDWATVELINNKINLLIKSATTNEEKIRSLKNDVAHYQSMRSKHQKILSDTPDLDEIERQTQLADKAAKLLDHLKEKILELKLKKSTLIQLANENNQKLAQCDDLGVNCETCGQDIESDHIEARVEHFKNKIESQKESIEKCEVQLQKLKDHQGSVKIERPSVSISEAKRILESNNQILEEINQLDQKIVSAKAKIESLDQINENLYVKIAGVNSKVESVKPKITLSQLDLILANYNNLNDKKTSLQKRLVEVKDEKNPYDEILIDAVSMIDQANAEIDNLNKKLEQLDTIYSHYRYIYRSYSDRRKIKKWLLSELIPFLNNRIQYYLDAFELDLSLSFNSTLSDEMDKWDYSFCSSGERKRIDVCITFALHDLLVSIYGQQCNLMILDEVDGHLDSQGVAAFAELVVNGLDNYSKPKSIFVVSHKPELKDAMPGHIIVRKKAGFSFIETMQK